ncbi:TolC family protein [Acidovorax sp. PRC11]|jgi:cobalt-zinc-cadmium efflux system outer membrane protein|uniref:TolC family protein n=1 Tax=Comamonadaceae TaxID=80864 RepID=UPI0028824618|nr:TolC family protein [Acidovorax sp. PRC11]MDT0136959.1 TolC family protein [Acidovorax sp. PRC11]
MFKGIYVQKQLGTRRGRQKVVQAIGTSLVLMTFSGVVSAQGAAPQMLAAQPATISPPAAADPAPLTLSQAIAQALESNPEVAAATRQVQASEGQVLQGQARPNPELAYSLEDTRSQTRSQSWQINLPIERGGKRDARTKAAQKAREQAQAELEEVKATLRANVVAAYFEALAARERLALAQDSVSLAKATTGNVSNRVAAGKVSPVEETKAKVAEAGVRVELAQAVSEERNAQTRLAALLGKAPASPLVLDGKAPSAPAVPAAQDLQALVSSSPTLVRARLEVDRRRALTAVEQSKTVPDVTVSLGVKRSNETQRNMALLGVSVPLPVFDRNQGNLLEALRLEDKARDELQAATLRVHSEIAQAREKAISVAAEIQALELEVLPGAKSAYDAAIVGFENGKFNFLEVLDAQRTYLAAKSQYLKAVAEAHRAAADMARLLGNSFPTGQSTPLN